MVGVGDRQRGVVHHTRDAREVRVADVLRLVGHLVIVEMLTAREGHCRNAIARVVVMVGAAIILERVSRLRIRAIEVERHGLTGVRRLEHSAELFR